MTRRVPKSYVLGVGKFRGMPLSRIPAGYLRWMIENDHEDADMAELELESRVDRNTSNIVISTSAIDAVSATSLDSYSEHRKAVDGGFEGIVTWLRRATREALQMGELVEREDTVVTMLHIDLHWRFRVQGEQLNFATVSKHA